MKDSEVLKGARLRIACGEADFVCYAIDTDEPMQKARLEDWVCSMLTNNHISYSGWLMKNHFKFYLKNVYPNGNHVDVCRAGRLAWLDWMIAYCEKEEAGL